MVPQRFATEYPQRCLQLLDAVELVAKRQNLLASFTVFAAASVLNIPLERLRAHHPFAARERGTKLHAALRKLEGRKWSDAEFWGHEAAGPSWHFARVVAAVNEVHAWQDEGGRPSVSAAANTIKRRRVGEVLRVLRNALAHGNIVYLNSDGREDDQTPVHYLAFLSRYEEDELAFERSETYRLVVATPEDFLSFVRRWASWLSAFPADDDLSVAA